MDETSIAANLDFAAIRDIHSIKRQINAHHGGAVIRVGGHNVKLGRGGIREIEFFVQTQQLIWGGHDVRLRSPHTLDALRALVFAGLVNENVGDEMAAAYRFLRRVEHRLQMIDDRQTHTLPDTAEGLRHVALFLGYPDTTAFAEELTLHLTRVERHYAALFEGSSPLGAADGKSEIFLQLIGKIGAQVSFDQAEIAADHSQGLAQVVRGDIGELLQFGIAAP